jgi:REP element-mobilizing transposase RayT
METRQSGVEGYTMTEPINKLHHRRSIRLADYDYSAEGGYYITIVTQGRVSLFGEVINGEMQLNDLGRIVHEEWFNTARLRPNVELLEDEFMVMPNHIHGIVYINNDGGWGDRPVAPTKPVGPPPKSIGAFVAGLKSSVTKRINVLRNTPGASVWQRNYYEHIIYSEKDYNNIVNYIYLNPLNWELDQENNQNH